MNISAMVQSRIINSNKIFYQVLYLLRFSFVQSKLYFMLQSWAVQMEKCISKKQSILYLVGFSGWVFSNTLFLSYNCLFYTLSINPYYFFDNCWINSCYISIKKLLQSCNGKKRDGLFFDIRYLNFVLFARQDYLFCSLL